MFSAINLQHMNMSHSEAYRDCATPQVDFRGCDVPALKHCILQDKCKTEEMAPLVPPCHAPGQSICSTFAHMDFIFWINQVINFFTYSEPCWWAFMLLLRLEMTEQSEGGNNSAYRRLLRGTNLPEQEVQQGYNSTSGVILASGGLIVFALAVLAAIHS